MKNSKDDDDKVLINSKRFQSLLSLKIPLTIKIGNQKLSLREILNIQPRQVIPLNQNVDDPVDVYVHDTKFGTGEMYIESMNYYFNVLETLEPEQRLAALTESGNIIHVQPEADINHDEQEEEEEEQESEAAADDEPDESDESEEMIGRKTQETEAPEAELEHTAEEKDNAEVSGFDAEDAPGSDHSDENAEEDDSDSESSPDKDEQVKKSHDSDQAAAEEEEEEEEMQKQAKSAERQTREAETEEEREDKTVEETKDEE